MRDKFACSRHGTAPTCKQVNGDRISVTYLAQKNQQLAHEHSGWTAVGREDEAAISLV